MPTVTVKMTDAQFAALQRVARERGVSKAGVLREAFLEREKSEPQNSGFDLIADLVGSAEGPADLATNPKYLKSYGRPRKRA